MEATEAVKERLVQEAGEVGCVVVKASEWAQMRGYVSLLRNMSTRFVADGEGDVIGPSLAEPEVWARLHQLEAGEAGTGVDSAGLADAVLRSLGLTIAEDGERFARLVVLIAEWFQTPKEATRA